MHRLSKPPSSHPLTEEDFSSHAVWVLERVLEYGNLEDVQVLRRLMGRVAFVRAGAEATRVSPRTRNFRAQMAETEGITCTKKFPRNTAWNC